MSLNSNRITCMEEENKSDQPHGNESIAQNVELPKVPSEIDKTAKPQSRMERLKKKIQKLQGKNPDIYPMW